MLLPSEAHHGMPAPTGTGFFVSPDWLFVTARHVVCEAGVLRSDISSAWLQKERRSLQGPPVILRWPELVFEDETSDVAVLRVSLERNKTKEWLDGRNGFPFVQIGTRLLDVGEPVCAFGYLLGSAEVEEAKGALVGTTTLAPRVTSAIVASTVENVGPVVTNADAAFYVLDRALNDGNSGGPIIATETGHAHAVCTTFQPMGIPQAHLAAEGGKPIAVLVPSLYGVVASLANQAVVDFLRSEGGRLSDK